jgi:hypothetical protein
MTPEEKLLYDIYALDEVDPTGEVPGDWHVWLGALDYVHIKLHTY